MTRRILAFALLAAAGCAARAVQAMSLDALLPELADTSEDQGSRESELYDRGTKALDDGNWEDAATAFQAVVQLGGSRSDGALYWVAYSLAKQGRRDDALAILRGFESKYPKSSWRKEARALELEIRPASRKTVLSEQGSGDDEDLKLMAINSLMNSEPDQAIPMLEKVLNGNGSSRVKERALFVLAQSPSPRARQILADAARGNARPELQEKAIHYLGVAGGRGNAELLASIYASATSTDVKEKILHAFMISGDKARVLEAARNEKSPELRASAVHQLGVIGAHSELWQMYRAESAESVKKEILKAMFIAGDVDHVLELARTESSATLKRDAIHNLGLMGHEKAGPALVSIYQSDKDPETRKAVIQGLFLQNNGKALVEIARSEKDMRLKTEAVSKLSLMQNRDATEYMLEILNH